MLVQERNLAVEVLVNIQNGPQLQPVGQVINELLDFILRAVLAEILYLVQQGVVNVIRQAVFFVQPIEHLDPVLSLLVHLVVILQDGRQGTSGERVRYDADQMQKDANYPLGGVLAAYVTVADGGQRRHREVERGQVELRRGQVSVLPGLDPSTDALVDVGDRSSDENPHAPYEVAHEDEAEEEHGETLESATHLESRAQFVHHFVVLLEQLH